MTIGFLSGPCKVPLACISADALETFDKFVAVVLAMHRGKHTYFATFARDGWERRACQVAHALNYHVKVYVREHEESPVLQGPNSTLTVISSEYGREEWLNSFCEHLFLWDYPVTLTPAFLRKANYIHLDKIA